MEQGNGCRRQQRGRTSSIIPRDEKRTTPLGGGEKKGGLDSLPSYGAQFATVHRGKGTFHTGWKGRLACRRGPEEKKNVRARRAEGSRERKHLLEKPLRHRERDSVEEVSKIKKYLNS